MKDNETVKGNVSVQRADNKEITPPHIRQNDAHCGHVEEYSDDRATTPTAGHHDASQSNAQNYLRRKFGNFSVQWLPLGEVCEIKRGKGLSKNDIGSGITPIILYGELYTTYGNYIDKIQSYCNKEKAEKSLSIKRGSIVMPITSTTKDAQIGKASVVNIDGVYLGGDAISLEHNENSGYLMYLLNSSMFNIEKMNYRNGTTVSHLSPKGIGEIIIPIPPLEVQAEVVMILDKFTSLLAELKAELKARELQYEYYRDQLLSFGTDDPTVQWLPLGEVCETITDYTAAGSFADLAKNVKYLRKEDGFAQLIRTTDLKSNLKLSDKFIYVDEHAFNYLWRVNLNETGIVLPNVGNCGEVYYIKPEEFIAEHNVLAPNAIWLKTKKVNDRYLYFLFSAEEFQNNLKKITTTTGQTKFNKTNLKNILIPIPSIAEQERIVGILDKFDKLTNSLTEGIPKEIEMRQLQYEYYRDALLSF